MQRTVVCGILEDQRLGLIRKLSLLIHDHSKPEAVISDGEDPLFQPNPPSDFEAEKTREFALRRERIAEKGYIGSEFVEPRLFNYRRRGLYNPSDR